MQKQGQQMSAFVEYNLSLVSLRSFSTTHIYFVRRMQKKKTLKIITLKNPHTETE